MQSIATLHCEPAFPPCITILPIAMVLFRVYHHLFHKMICLQKSFHFHYFDQIQCTTPCRDHFIHQYHWLATQTVHMATCRSTVQIFDLWTFQVHWSQSGLITSINYWSFQLKTDQCQTLPSFIEGRAGHMRLGWI